MVLFAKMQLLLCPINMLLAQGNIQIGLVQSTKFSVSFSRSHGGNFQSVHYRVVRLMVLTEWTFFTDRSMDVPIVILNKSAACLDGLLAVNGSDSFLAIVTFKMNPHQRVGNYLELFFLFSLALFKETPPKTDIGPGVGRCRCLMTYSTLV
jgi:hypothetical protein